MDLIEKWRLNNARHDEAAWVRLRSEIKMAKWMAGRDPGNAVWANALAEAQRDITGTDIATTAVSLVERVESALKPFSNTAKKFKVHCIGHAHIDMNWMWGWPETVMSTLDSFRTVLALMEEFPSFKFSQSQVSVYEITRQFDPELFMRISERIKEGRWEVTATHWVENDMNLVSGEALVRHLLQARSYTKEHFGLSPEDADICWVPDSFGHSATQPNYLVRGGIRRVYLHRPGCEKQPVPEAFWWVGTDGSRVIVKNDQRRAYNCVIEPNTMFDSMRMMEEGHGIKTSQVVYGVGDHGGGPTRRDLLMLEEMNSWPVFPTLEFSTSRAFFDEFEQFASGLPVVKGELNTEMTGCYTTQALIKRDNRIGENRMLDVETVTAWAAAAGVKLYQSVDYGQKFNENWQRVLFSHFHDILPGSCVRDTRLYCHGNFQETMAFTSTATQQTLRALALNVATAEACGSVSTPPREEALYSVDGFGSGSGIGAKDGSFGTAHWHGLSGSRPFVVFNPTAFERTETVKFMLWDRNVHETAETFRQTRFHAVNSSGKPVPTQFIKNGHEWGHLYQSYEARVTVPSMGYTTVVFHEKGEDSPPVEKEGGMIPVSRLATPPGHCNYMSNERVITGLENDKFSVRFDSVSGRIVSLYDKVSKFEMVDPEIGIGLEYAVEQPGGSSAWVVFPARKVVVPNVQSMNGVMNGPLVSTVEIVYKIERSHVKLVYSLNAGEAALRVDFTADWLESGSQENGIPNLRFVAGTVLEDSTPVYEIPFGALPRPRKDDREEPALRWAMLEATKEPSSLLVCNDCKYGHAADGGALRVNLIRSAYSPDPFPELGQHEASLLIAVVPRGFDRASAAAIGQAFNHQLFIVGTDVHDGKWPSENAFVTCDGDGVVFDCFKRAEDGNGFIVRLHNTKNEDASCVVRFNQLFGKLASVETVDLLERPEEGPAVKPAGSGAGHVLTIAAESIASFRFAFQ